MRVTELTESSGFYFVLKPIDTLQQSPDRYRVGAAPFSTIYPFILLFHIFRFSFIITISMQV